MRLYLRTFKVRTRKVEKISFTGLQLIGLRPGVIYNPNKNFVEIARLLHLLKQLYKRPMADRGPLYLRPIRGGVSDIDEPTSDKEE